MFFLFPSPLFGQADQDQAVESGREALRSMWDVNWYDAQQDRVSRLEVEPPPPPRPPSNSNWNTGGWFSGLGTAMQVLMWVLLAALLAALAYGIYLAFRNADRRRILLEDDAEDEDRKTAIDRVEELPINIRRGRGNLLDEARRHSEQGAYSEAMVYLYSYFLVQLDKRQFIRLTRGKTNRQYLREISGPAPLRYLMENAMILFEDAFFGKRQLSQTQFDLCWNRLDDFHQWTEHGQK